MTGREKRACRLFSIKNTGKRPVRRKVKQTGLFDRFYPNATICEMCSRHLLALMKQKAALTKMSVALCLAGEILINLRTHVLD